MYGIKFIEDTHFHIDDEDYKRIIDALNNHCEFVEITARYTHFKDIKILLNIKNIIYICEE